MTTRSKAYRFSPDQLALHALWLKALRDGEVSVTCDTLSDAKRLRFALYNAVKPIRDEKAHLPEVLKAVESCSISAEGLTVTLREKTKTSLMRSVLGVVGGTVAEFSEQAQEAVVSPEIAESLERLLNRDDLTTAPGAAPSNPYYTRER